LDIYSALSLVQRVKPGMVVETRSLVKIAGSKATLSRALKVLEEYGFVWGRARGWVAFADALWQPAYVIESILPSLRAIRGAVPVRCPRKAFELLRDFFVTLDWKAWELTGYQTPRNLYVYADSVEDVIQRLRAAGLRRFSKGGELVYVLPRVGDFSNPTERTYLDCVARGGRSWLDAVAIELLYPDELSVRAVFPVGLVEKVIEDLSLRSKEAEIR